jgi:hypothetical protein
LPEKSIKNITLEDIDITAEDGFICSDAENMKMKNVIITANKKEEI